MVTGWLLLLGKAAADRPLSNLRACFLPAPPLPAAELPVVFGEDKGKGVVVRALLVQAPAGGYEYEVSARSCYEA